MTLNIVPLLLGAATVGIVHMAAPDHWVTLVVLGRSESWTRSKIFKVSLITSIGHVLLSLALGIAVAAVGIVFSNLILGYLETGIGVMMIVIGLIVGARPLFSKFHKHDHHQRHHHEPFVYGEHRDEKETKKLGMKLANNVGYFSVLGAALSPDPSIIPIFLASIPAGFYFLIELAIIFAATSVLTLVLLVLLGNKGFAKILERIPEKYNGSLVGFVIVAIGVFILVS